MSNILEIGYIEYSEQTKRVNWDQLLRARADNPNLRIYVQHYNDPDSTGAQDTFIATKIMIVDYNTNDVYFTVFAEILQTSESRIPVSASPDADRILEMINSYGFNVRLSEPTPVTDRVLTILRGLYAAGYRYVYRDYIQTKETRTISMIYASQEIKSRKTGFNISKTPDFIEDDWDWCDPNTSYAISDILERGTVPIGQLTGH